MERRVDGEVVLCVVAGAIAGVALAGVRATPRGRVAGAAIGALAGGAVGLVRRRVAGRRQLPPHGPVTQSLVPLSPADTVIGPPGANVEQRLDEAIQETYPASDPISVRIE
jgi:hypothetical protein